MSTLLRIIMLVFAVAVLWLVSLFGVDAFYQGQVHDKAFYCKDDCGIGIFTSMSSHQAAGDTLSSGWTWDKIEKVRQFYEIAFYVVWLGGSAIIFMMLFLGSQKKRAYGS